MRNIIYLALAGGLLILNSCDKTKNKVDYTLNFQLVNGGSNYSLETLYNTSDNISTSLESVRFYMANLYFVNDENEDVLAKDIELVTFNTSGIATVNFELPVDKYSNIKFGIGVPEELNSADPSNYNTDPDHPLNSLNSTYWGWTAMYRFVMYEGRFDADGDGSTEGLLSMHTGYNSSYRNVEFPVELSLKKKETYTTNFEVDVYDFFDASAASKIDIVTENQYHGSTAAADIDLANRISDNFAASIKLVE